MILKFKDYIKLNEEIPYDTYNGPPITTWSGDNRSQISTDQVAAGNGGQIGGEWYKKSGPTSKGGAFPRKWKEKIDKPIDNKSKKRKKAIEKIKALLKMDLEKTLKTKK